MRKLITSSVIILLFAMFSGSVFAGKHAVCEDFKKSKRFYGLCNAYQNALAHEDLEAATNIFQNWSKFVDEYGDPQLPNHAYEDELPSEDDPLPGEEQVPECPCWSIEDMRVAACNYKQMDDALVYPGFGAFVQYDDGEVVFKTMADTEPFCAYQDYYSSIQTGDVLISHEQYRTCEAGIDLMVNGDLTEFCTPSE
jgi:hypothetical protein